MYFLMGMWVNKWTLKSCFLVCLFVCFLRGLKNNFKSPRALVSWLKLLEENILHLLPFSCSAITGQTLRLERGLNTLYKLRSSSFGAVISLEARSLSKPNHICICVTIKWLKEQFNSKNEKLVWELLNVCTEIHVKI